ncbi:hypothetical protein Poli38472_008186 [Pythium oligandrum]|uniref:AGC protein kinase n=1 Tax=Pythium oligandrum TaxID=41045 RepID=A0A8K1CL60_PYTOL|nr:hypothetical protein Poli38472_008186 [Pythium oligandrum]|eukprot:TMW65544.1 hypothetical protein Poli38472_008186 [Pythium oligandrum]
MIRVKWERVNGSLVTESNDSVTSLHPQPAPRRRAPPPPPPMLGKHSSSSISSNGSSGSVGPSSLLPSRRGLGIPSGVIPEMDTISEDSVPAEATPEWGNNLFHMNERGEVVNRRTNAKLSKDEMRDHGEEILKGLIDYVHSRMLRECQFVEQAIPELEFETDSVASSYSSGTNSVRSSSSSICSTADGFRTMVDSDVPRCIFHTSENYSVAEKLLVFVCSSRGLSCGIWSRTLLMQEGAQVGSMIPYFHAARQAGYGIVVMNPNMNTQLMKDDDGVERKLPIEGSSTQEEHCDHVWRKYIFPSAAHKIHFIAYGYGGVLVTQLIEKYKYELRNRLGNVAYIESSHKMEPQWSTGFKRFISQHSICWQRSKEPLNVEIGTTNDGKRGPEDGSPIPSPMGTASPSSSASSSPRLHSMASNACIMLSAGVEENSPTSPAYTTKMVLNTVFKFLQSPSAYEFHRMIMREVRMNALKTYEENGGSSGPSPRRGRGATSTSPRPPGSRERERVTLDDFQLLRVVGRGAFGKVMLVRKKKQKRSVASPSEAAAAGAGKIFAMKVIKKAAVFAKNQVEHTKTERRILEGVDHPFMVKLRYAFQSDSKLYFVMDYYNGGTLHFHLRQARRFSEERARFYAAQIVMALSHMHTYNMVYRDLKPENILMDDEGFIALTDFGLSTDHFDAKGEGLQTFCGTPEYIAPELIRRQPYGKSVDYWSLGAMLFEMFIGHTPFFHTNRKRNFENIVRQPLRFPNEGLISLSDDAKSLVHGLLTKDPAKRLGSGPYGAQEIMNHPFFASVDWERLYKRDVVVPFRPVVKKDGELVNIPEFFKRQDVMDSAPDAPAPIGKQHEFQNFTYVDPYQLG